MPSLARSLPLPHLLQAFDALHLATGHFRRPDVFLNAAPDQVDTFASSHSPLSSLEPSPPLHGAPTALTACSARPTFQLRYSCLIKITHPRCLALGHFRARDFGLESASPTSASPRFRLLQSLASLEQNHWAAILLPAALRIAPLELQLHWTTLLTSPRPDTQRKGAHHPRPKLVNSTLVTVGLNFPVRQSRLLGSQGERAREGVDANKVGAGGGWDLLKVTRCRFHDESGIEPLFSSSWSMGDREMERWGRRGGGRAGFAARELEAGGGTKYGDRVDRLFLPRKVWTGGRWSRGRTGCERTLLRRVSLARFSSFVRSERGWSVLIQQKGPIECSSEEAQAGNGRLKGKHTPRHQAKLAHSLLLSVSFP